MESQPGCSKQYSISLFDPQTTVEYDLLLNEEDYKRAQEDVAFASTLLNFAKKDGEENDGDLNKENIEEQESSNEVWDYNAVISLLSCMENNMEDMQHPKKRRHVFSNVSNELLSNGFKHSATACYNKWRSLLRSYKNTKDKKIKTGRGASRFMFFEKMDNLLGDKPSISASHTLESGDSNNSLSTNSRENVSLSENHGDVELDSKSSVENKKCDDSRTKYFRKRKRDVDIREVNKEKRHTDRLSIEREKLNLEKQKMEVLQKILDKLNEK